MRFRQKRGNKPARITLSEEEIFDACREYIKRLDFMKGSRLDSCGAIAIPKVLHKVDKRGRKTRTKVEFLQEIHDEQVVCESH